MMLDLDRSDLWFDEIDQAGAVRGLVSGVVLSIPLWIGILIFVWRLLW